MRLSAKPGRRANTLVSTLTTMTVEVRDNPDQHRFEITAEGEPAGFAAYRVRGNVVTVTHSEVDPRFRGHGLASELARQTLDTLRQRGNKVVPSCPFFAKYIGEHPEYDDIVED
jgi:predicted GNAT family acetyltransferase